MAEKVTTMRLKVDLHCEKCYKKVKKVLCKFPQIREQEFDEKQNIVTIKGVCCSPEKIRDQLCCKSCGVIKSIEIVEQTKLQPCEPKKTKPPSPPPCRVPSRTCCVPPLPPCPPSPPPPPTCCVPCSEGRPGGPYFEGCGRPPPPPVCRVPIRTCCGPCSEGRPCWPCFEGCGRPPPCYEGYLFVRPVYDIHGRGRPCNVSCCDEYFNEDNATGCTIM